MTEISTGLSVVFERELFPEHRGETEQAAVVVAVGDELYAAGGRRQNDGGIASQTGGRSEAQDAGAGIGVVGSGEELSLGRDGGEEKIELLKELLVLMKKGGVAAAQVVDFDGCECCAPFEARGDEGIEFAIETGVELGSFMGLDGRVDIPGFAPEGSVQRFQFCARAGEAVAPERQDIEHFRIAGFEQRAGQDTDAVCGGGILRGQIEERVGKQREIAKVATEPADGVEGRREVIAAVPVPGAEGGAVAGESAEGGGGADRTAGVGADGSEGRAFLDGSSGTTG